MDQLKIFAAEYLIAVPVVIIVALLAWRLFKFRDWRFLAFVVVGGIISLVLSRLGSHFIEDPRPFVQGNFTPLVPHDKDNGFPSDHTLLAAFIAFAITIVRPKIGWPLIVVAVLVGLGRMGVGVHHSWDVLGSFVFAFAGATAAAWLVGKAADRINAKNVKKNHKETQASQ